MRTHRLPTALLAFLGACAATLAIAACGGGSPASATTSSTSTHTTSSHHKFHSGGKSGY